MTPDEIATAISLEADSIEGDPALRAMVPKLRWWATLVRALPMVTTGGNLADMEPASRIAASKRMSPPSGSSSLVDACHEHSMSLRELGTKVGVSHAMLSAAAAGRKRIPPGVRQRVLAVVGWDSWPKA